MNHVIVILTGIGLEQQKLHRRPAALDDGVLVAQGSVARADTSDRVIAEIVGDDTTNGARLDVGATDEAHRIIMPCSR